MNKQDDRKLLELAAKAGGYVPVRWTDDETALLLEGVQEPWNALHKNPHSDCMGDALRLAVDLGLMVDCVTHEKETAACTDGMICEIEPHNNNPHAATCRAIVRAAVGIAKAGGAV